MAWVKILKHNLKMANAKYILPLPPLPLVHCDVVLYVQFIKYLADGYFPFRENEVPVDTFCIEKVYQLETHLVISTNFL